MAESCFSERCSTTSHSPTPSQVSRRARVKRLCPAVPQMEAPTRAREKQVRLSLPATTQAHKKSSVERLSSMPRRGVEPPRPLRAHEPESCASANSATGAGCGIRRRKTGPKREHGMLLSLDIPNNREVRKTGGSAHSGPGGARYDARPGWRNGEFCVPRWRPLTPSGCRHAHQTSFWSRAGPF